MATEQELREPLMPGSEPGHDTFDYVIVFYNPFQSDIPEGKHKSKKKFSKKEAKEIFLGTFRTAECDESNEEEEQVIKVLRTNLNAWLQQYESIDKDEKVIPFDDFAEFVSRMVILHMQVDLHLQLQLFMSIDKDQIFCKIKASEDNLKSHADLVDYKLQFVKHPQDTKPYMHPPPHAPYEKKESGNFGGALQHLAGKSKATQDKDKLFKRYSTKTGVEVPNDSELEEGTTLFRYVDRVRIIFDMITQYIDTAELEKHGIIECDYPLHDERKLADFRRTFSSWKATFKTVDLCKIRNYFGEDVSLYFAYLVKYLLWLIVPCIVGLICYTLDHIIGGWRDDVTEYTVRDILVLCYSFVLALAATSYDQYWLRREKRYALDWGMIGWEKREFQRAEYEGVRGKDELTGQIKKLPTRKKSTTNAIAVIAWSITWIFIFIVIAIVVGLFFWRALLRYSQWGPRLIAFLNACQIKVMNWIYKMVAVKLNDWENHETESSYNNALVVKLFLFQFVNSYNSLIYIAFFKGKAEGCVDDDCMGELTIQLSTIFATNFALNFLELGIPWFSNKFKAWKEKRKLKKMTLDRMTSDRSASRRRETMTYTEEQAAMSNYSSTIEDYMELIIQYGYVVMFSSAFPLIPLLALVLCVVEIRVDAIKFVDLKRRPFPHGRESIGQWNSIISLLSMLGVFFNAAILSWTANIFKSTNHYQYWFYFFVIDHILLGCKTFIAGVIKDEPTIVKNAKIWQKKTVDERLFMKSLDISTTRKARKLELTGAHSSCIFDAGIPEDNVLE